MDNKVQNREWVKTAAIIFLSVLLVLTFFSNTIMNRTLTEVATAEAASGTITAKIRGTGTVTAIGNTEIKSTCTTTVASVKAKAGQEVNEGDILIIMGEQSEELEKAQEELSDLQYQLMSANASSPIDTDSIEVQAAETALTIAEENYDAARAKYEASLNSENPDPDAKKIWDLYNDANTQYIDAQTKYADLTSKLDKLRSDLADDYATKQANADANKDDKDAQNAAAAAKIAYENTFKESECAIYAEINAVNDTISFYKAQMEMYSAQLGKYKSDFEDAQSALDSAKSKYESAKNTQFRNYAETNQTAYANYVKIAQIQAAIAKQQEKITKLQGGEDNAIKAPVSGTISSIEVSPGSSVAKGDILCTIEVPDMGYSVSFDVTNDQARRLKVGDSATVSNFYWGTEITATISSIKVSPKEPQTKKSITFDIDGNVSSGSELTIAVGQKSATYDVIVPSSAVRNDSNGTFVLRVTSKNSALGNRYFVERVNVEQLATDDVSTAVSGDLSNGDFVVTTSSAPVKNGDQVRMADN